MSMYGRFAEVEAAYRRERMLVEVDRQRARRIGRLAAARRREPTTRHHVGRAHPVEVAVRP
jgi:hypothetical protein